MTKGSGEGSGSRFPRSGDSFIGRQEVRGRTTDFRSGDGRSHAQRTRCGGADNRLSAVGRGMMLTRTTCGCAGGWLRSGSARPRRAGRSAWLTDGALGGDDMLGAWEWEMGLNGENGRFKVR